LRAILYCALLILVAACAMGEPPQLLSPEDEMALDDVLRSAVAAGGVPGVVALVATRDSVIYRGVYGVMDAVGDEAMTDDAIFRIASMTKPITSVGIMMLREDGLLDLDDAASEYLPELADREVLVEINSADSSVTTRPATRPITIRDLLRHTAGIGYSFSSHELLELARSTDIPAREQPLLHDPGTRWTYGMSTAFLGWVIEEVTGETLPEFFESRILRPLGMVDTGPDLAQESHHRLVAMYRRVDGVLQGEPRPDQYRPEFRGDGGLLSTADDYVRFMQMILGSGERDGVRLLTQESVSEMVQNQLEGVVVVEQPGAIPSTSRAFPLGAGQDGFGLGFQISFGESVGGRPPGSLSWAGIANTHFWIDRENEIAVVLLVQLLPFYDEMAIDFLTSFERTLYSQIY